MNPSCPCPSSLPMPAPAPAPAPASASASAPSPGPSPISIPPSPTPPIKSEPDTQPHSSHNPPPQHTSQPCTPLASRPQTPNQSQPPFLTAPPVITTANITTSSYNIETNAAAGPSRLPFGHATQIHDENHRIHLIDQAMERRKRKLVNVGFSHEETDDMARKSSKYALAIALDQQSTLFPSPPTPFSSFDDAVHRLLPYHIWQIHEDELLGEKTEEEDRQELEFSEDIVKRILGIRERFAKLRRREADHPSHLPSLIYLNLESTADASEEYSQLSASYRIAKSRWSVYEDEARRRADAEIAKIEAERRKVEDEKRRKAEEEKRKAEIEAARKEPEKRRLESQFVGSTQPGSVPGVRPVVTPVSGPSSTLLQQSTRRPPFQPGVIHQQQQAIPSLPMSAKPLTPQTHTRPPLLHQSVSPQPRPIGTPTSAPRPRGRPPRSASQQGTPQSTSKSTGKAAVPVTSTVTTMPMPRPPVPSTSTSTPGVAGPSTGTQGYITSGEAQKPKSTMATFSVAIPVAQQLIACKIINVPYDPKAPKPPGTVVRTTEDKKGVVLSVDVAACTQQQLQVLARVLNINVKASSQAGTAGTGAGMGVGLGAGASVRPGMTVGSSVNGSAVGSGSESGSGADGAV